MSRARPTHLSKSSRLSPSRSKRPLMSCFSLQRRTGHAWRLNSNQAPIEPSTSSALIPVKVCRPRTSERAAGHLSHTACRDVDSTPQIQRMALHQDRRQQHRMRDSWIAFRKALAILRNRWQWDSQKASGTFAITTNRVVVVAANFITLAGRSLRYQRANFQMAREFERPIGLSLITSPDGVLGALPYRLRNPRTPRPT